MRLRALFVVLAASVVAFSCGKTPEEPDPQPAPQPQQQQITVPAESQPVFNSGLSLNSGSSGEGGSAGQAQTSTVKFTATASWSADVNDTRSSSWLSVQPTSGGAGDVTMTVTAQPNTGTDSRTASVSIKCGNNTKTFSVTQAGVPSSPVAVESVSLNKAELTLEPGGSETLSATVLPENATDKTVTWGTSDAEIATVEGGKVTALKEGTATISAIAGGKTASCKVTVKTDLPFSLSPTSVQLEATVSTFDVTVTCSTTYHLNSKPDWITEKSVNGKVHTFEAAENTSTDERSGVIVFCDDKGTCLPCNVKQNGQENPDVPFSLSPTTVNLGSSASSFDVTVTCSTTYHLNSKPDWITETAVNGKVHTFTAAENTSAADRSGVIVFCDDKGTCLPCNVKQKRKEGDNPGGFDWTKEFYHQSLFMRFTATWCGYCPMMAEAAKRAQQKHPGKIQVMNLHASGSDLYFSEVGSLESAYGISGYPQGVMDGRKSISNSSSIDNTASSIETALTQLENAVRPVTTVAWNSTLSGRSLSIDLDVYIKVAGSYKVTVVLTESNIINYQEDYNDGNHANYQHNDVVRMAVSSINGDPFTVNENNHIEKKSYQVVIPAEYNKDNMSILVYIQRAYGEGVSRIEGSDYSGWYVDNCNAGKAGGSMNPAIAKDGSGGENEDVIGGNPINW